MGVTYKLKPEIQEYILEKKKNNPDLSCRGLMPLVEEKFQLKVSKSSINSIIKEFGLSMSVGRRRKKRRRQPIDLRARLQAIGFKEPLVEPASAPPVQPLQEEKPEEALGVSPFPASDKPLEVPVKPLQEGPRELPVEVPSEKPADGLKEPPPEKAVTPAETKPVDLSLEPAPQESPVNTAEPVIEKQDVTPPPLIIEDKIAEEPVELPVQMPALESEDKATKPAEIEEKVQGPTPASKEYPIEQPEDKAIAPSLPEPPVKGQAEKPDKPLIDKSLETPLETSTEKAKEKPVAGSSEGPRIVPISAPVDSQASTPAKIPIEPPIEIILQKPVEPDMKKPIPGPVEETPAGLPSKEPIEGPPEVTSAPPMAQPQETPKESRSSSEVSPVRKPAQTPIAQPIPKPIMPSPEIKVGSFAANQCSGVVLLKAADLLMGGSISVSELVSKHLNAQTSHIAAKTESLIYLPLFSSSKGTRPNDPQALWSLIGAEISAEEIKAFNNELQRIDGLGLDIFRLFYNASQEARSLEVILADDNIIYLDGQLHTVWSAPNIPYAFASTPRNITQYINKWASENTPLILFMAPGYDCPNKELFNFIYNLDSIGQGISRILIYNNKLDRLDNIEYKNVQNKTLIFGLWPWQFSKHRRVKKIGDFKPFFVESLNKECYLAEAEITLLQPITKLDVTLKGCALKSSLNSKVRLVILGNQHCNHFDLKELANFYLDRWPNFEETFQDYSRKIEFFSYTVDSQRHFLAETLFSHEDLANNIDSLFITYTKALDLYVREHFLPTGYQQIDFLTVKERIYDLPVSLQEQNRHILLKFLPKDDYKYKADLEYIRNRINEREIFFTSDKRLRMEVG